MNTNSSARRLVRRLMTVLGLRRAARRSSTGYRVITREEAFAPELDGWMLAEVARKQEAAFARVLADMYAGTPRVDLIAAADAVRAAGIENPELLEIGCGSGYYAEILPHLLGAPIRYTGLDYSEAMIAAARARYPDVPFVQGDATALPMADDTFDIVLNGAALMHIADHAAAIREAARVARSWCIFHTVTVHSGRPTTYLRKQAYGGPTAEVSFNEQDLRQAFADAGLAVHTEFASIAYDLLEVVGEHTRAVTFLCRTEDRGQKTEKSVSR